jgi:hypothetical protein
VTVLKTSERDQRRTFEVFNRSWRFFFPMSEAAPEDNTDRSPNLFPKTGEYFLFLKEAKLVAKVVIGVPFVDEEQTRWN